MDKRKNPEKNDIGTAIKERPGILFAIQLALRVKYPDIIVDGESWENTRKVIIKCIKEKDPEIEQITLKDIYRVIYILWINLRPENSDYQNIPKVSEEEAKKDLKKYHLTSNIW